MRLEAIEEIKQLKSRYMKCCDDGYDPEEFASFFTEQGSWVGGEESYTGRKDIAEFIRRVRHELVWNFHYPVSPIIEFSADGQHADVRWFALIVQSVQEGGEGAPMIDMANYVAFTDTVECVDGQWLFSKVQPNFSRSWDLGAGDWRTL